MNKRLNFIIGVSIFIVLLFSFAFWQISNLSTGIAIGISLGIYFLFLIIMSIDGIKKDG